MESTRKHTQVAWATFEEYMPVAVLLMFRNVFRSETLRILMEIGVEWVEMKMVKTKTRSKKFKLYVISKILGKFKILSPWSLL